MTTKVHLYKHLGEDVHKLKVGDVIRVKERLHEFFPRGIYKLFYYGDPIGRKGVQQKDWSYGFTKLKADGTEVPNRSYYCSATDVDKVFVALSTT